MVLFVSQSEGVKIVFMYSQTCSNDHLYKTATPLRWPMLSLSKQIPIQSLMYNTNHLSNITRDHIYCLPNGKRNLSKTITKKLYRAIKWGEATMHKKDISLIILLHCYFIIQSLFNIYKSWTIYKII